MKENYTPGQGCECHAHSEAECGCDVDWTPREVYELREQRDRLQNELNELKEDRDAWKSEALIMDARLRGVKHPNDNGIFSPDEVIPKLEREIAAVTEQRDRLAEALRIVMADYRLDGRVSAEADMLAREALAAAKGEKI